MSARFRMFALLFLSTALFACDDGDGAGAGDGDGDDGTGGMDMMLESDAGPQQDAGSEPDAEVEPEPLVHRCVYTNPFANSTDCKQYTGAGWSPADIEADCASVFVNTAGIVEEGACTYENELGRCAADDPADKGYVLVSEGSDAANCALTQTACETFAMGAFESGNTCGGGGDIVCEADGRGPGFRGPKYECRDPIDGEPAGDGPNGQVCTFSHISASTEEGRNYADYADCNHVYEQGRPYFAIENPIENDPADARLADDSWMAEATWVTQQIESSACVCCHSNSVTPNGYSVWNTEGGPLWFDQFSKPGLAMMAGMVSSDSFGAFDAADNNGFDRTITGAPTTDVDRMKAFFEAEFARRGGTPEDAERYDDFGGPLAAQLKYEPLPCDDGVGVMADGTLMWNGGGARYVYVIAEDGANPGAPPNLDVPDDTIWMLSVAPDDSPIACGTAYGEVPDGASQRVPATGDAPALVSGETYYFVALSDTILPLERCTFVFDGQ